MPDHIFSNSGGALFIDGKMVASDIGFEEIAPAPETIPATCRHLTDEAVEVEIKCRLTSRQKLLLMTGKWYSNNYLKMHGGIMERRGGKRKKKRRNKGE